MLKNQYGQYLLNVIEEIKRTGTPNNDMEAGCYSKNK
jgi:hypothetical protein